MASGTYKHGMGALMARLTSASPADITDIRCVLIKNPGSPYVPNFTTDANLSDITAGTYRPIAAVALTSKSVGGTGGNEFSAATLTFPTVTTGITFNALVIYVHTGTESTSTLLAYIDTATLGLPITSDGRDIVVTWASNIFSVG